MDVEFGFFSAFDDAEHGGLELLRVADFATKVILDAASIGISLGRRLRPNAALPRVRQCRRAHGVCLA